MRITRELLAILVLALACAPAVAQDESPAPTQTQSPISQAETMLFLTDHLKQLKTPTLLSYRFTRDGTLESRVDDSVDVNVKSKGKEGGNAVSTRFLSGDNAVKYPPVPDAEGNPVILWFLERDIKEMERLTGGKSPYFKKRIRLALADSAEVRPVKFAFGGKEVSGTEIKVAPYLDDPNKPKFGKMHTKYYVFTLSDQVPGNVYQMRAVVPAEDGAGDAQPLIDETLTFAKATARGTN